MFRGITSLSLDAKGRVAIPARYREELQASCDGQLVVTVHPDHCLMIYPLPEWEPIEQALMSKPNMADPDVRWMQRLLCGHAEKVEFDAQGRILLPSKQREFAYLDRRAVLVGQGKKFELWDEETWNQQFEDLGQGSSGGKPGGGLETLTL